jgi:hypothetical protein
MPFLNPISKALLASAFFIPSPAVAIKASISKVAGAAAKTPRNG